MSAVRDRLCHDEYNSLNEARSAAQSAGFNLGYAGFTIGANGAQQNAGGKTSISQTSFCSANSADVRASLASNYEEQVTNVAVKAWADCVRESQENLLYISYKLRPDATGFDGLLHLTANQGALGRTITGILVGGVATTVRCNIGGKWYSPEDVQKEPAVIQTTGTALSCNKDSDVSANVSFQTSQGAVDFIELPTKIDLTSSRTSDLFNTLAEMQLKISDLQSYTQWIKGVKLYKCHDSRATDPYNLDGNWLWASFGCNGQISSSDFCENIGWSGSHHTNEHHKEVCTPVNLLSDH